MEDTMDYQNQAQEAVKNGEASEATQRAVELDKLATDLGFTHFTGSENGQTFFAWGTELGSDGKDTFRSKVKLHDDMPFANDVAGQFESLIEREARHDVNRKMAQVAFDGTNKVKLAEDISNNEVDFDGYDHYSIGRWAMGQLLTRSGAPTGALSCLMPTSGHKLGNFLASEVFNSYMNQTVTGGKEPSAKSVRLRTRSNGRGGREVFAAMSPRSPIYDGVHAIQAFVKASHPTARGSVVYDGRKWKFTATVMSHIEPTVGEIFEARVFISGCDDGSAGITVGSEVVRVRCLNLTTLHAAEVTSIKHQGKQEKVAERIMNELAKANERINAFADIWAKAETDHIADNAQEHGVDKIFQVLVDKKLVHVVGVDKTDMVDRLMTAWTAEPGYSKADILNAITRAAHSNPWSNPWAAQTLSDQAGGLLYQKVYVTERDFKLLEVN